MKFSTVPVALVAAAGLVSAAPIRIIFLGSSQPIPPPDVAPKWVQSLRWGHAAAPAFNLPPVESWANPTPTRHGTLHPVQDHAPMQAGEIRRPAMRKGGCRTGMRQESFGDRLRVILGLPPIGRVGPSHPVMVESHFDADGTLKWQRISKPALSTHHRNHMRPNHHRTPFMIRLSHALASLGPWEGRAVSFVLGCGLGVLLRMLFVFGVLIVRSARTSREERQITLEEDSVIFAADIKEPVVVETLPAYAEKPETVAEEAPQTNNAH